MSTKTEVEPVVSIIEVEPVVSIIILSWNSWEDTLECLESVYQINYLNYNLIVVDNASQDGSVEKIEEYCKGEIEVQSNFFNFKSDNKPIEIIKIPEDSSEFNINEENLDSPQFNINEEILDLPSDRKLFLIENRENYGYAEGNNVGIREALKIFDPEYILLLNNDTVVDENFLKRLVEIAQNDPLAGVLNPKILDHDQPQKIHSVGGRIIWSLGVGENIGYEKIDEGQYH
ncbi:MAG TPA: glycosyltransferase family 2 protein, partial [Methanobacterium sp.]